MAQLFRVVVRKPAPVEPVVGDSVPLLAGDLAGLAADAESRIGQERRQRHDSSIARVCLSREAPFCGRGSTLQSSALVSMIRTFGSSEIAIRSFAEPPLTRPR